MSASDGDDYIQFPKLMPFLLVIGILVFVFAMCYSLAEYYEAIDPVNLDEGYTPLAQKHLFSLIVFYALALVGTMKVWRKGRTLPPLALVLSVTFMVIWSIISIFIIIQVSSRSDGKINFDSTINLFFIIPVAFHLFINLVLFINLLKESAQVSEQRHYKNRLLNYLNRQLAGSKHHAFWVILIVFPLLILILLILLLFGQEPDSLVKVFTETTTWQLSQKAHPPYLDHQGHYLCTVAACGTPSIVKPIRLGNRHGNTIIVNRQLQIANAFEELLQERFKRTHKVIRSSYDKYGYNLSKKITSPAGSNLTYLLMKPIEWGFLIVLYFCCLEPEKKIAKQYN